MLWFLGTLLSIGLRCVELRNGLRIHPFCGEQYGSVADDGVRIISAQAGA